MTAALEAGEWSAARPGRSLPRERSGIHFTGSWVGHRNGLDGRKILVPTGIRSRIFQPVAQSLYRLSYRAHLGVITPSENTEQNVCPKQKKGVFKYVDIIT